MITPFFKSHRGGEKLDGGLSAYVALSAFDGFVKNQYVRRKTSTSLHHDGLIYPLRAYNKKTHFISKWFQNEFCCYDFHNAFCVFCKIIVAVCG